MTRERAEPAHPPASPRHCVLADDLTGAADAGVQFALAGLRVRLELGELRNASSEEAPDVLAYSTDSRAISASEAYRRTRAAAVAAGAHTFYKKVDSTLRGNLGAEIEALIDVTPNDAALLCPAFPEQRRTVIDGHLLIEGTPVSQTSFAEDPAAPVHQSHIPTLLAQQSRRKVGTVDLSCVSGGPAAVSTRLSALLDAGVTIVVADAARDVDLECLVDACAHTESPILLCGSAGLAAQLAARPRAPVSERPTATERVVAVVGSTNPAAIAQAEVLSRRARWPLLRIDLAAALAGGGAWRAWLEDARRDLAALAEPASGVVLAVAKDHLGAASRGGVGPCEAHAALVAERLAEFAEIAIACIRARGAILTGGDTAVAVLRRLGARGVDLVGELDRGVPFGWVRGGEHDRLLIATKAGGFGAADVLWRAASCLAGGGAAR